MIDYDILAKCGTTDDRLRQVFTAEMPARPEELTEEERERIKRDIKTREIWETQIRDRLEEHINFSLKNQALYGAVDLAMDAAPINKETYPLVLYAQGKLDQGSCIQALTDLKCAEQYVTKDDKGKEHIELQAFLETEINIIRSFVKRRKAAQDAKYNSLWPFYPYESRSTSLVGKLRADAWSQRVDIMADQLGYRHHDSQVLRDMLLYCHSVDFVRAAWEREVQWQRKFTPGLDTDKVEYEPVVVKEGLNFVNPHPTRIFWDAAYPLSSINNDNGCDYIGYWDIVPYRAAKNNPAYFNKQKINFSTGFVSLLSNYSVYFTQYYDRVTIPETEYAGNPALENDRISNIGRYASNEDDASMLQAVYFAKMVPKDWGIGDYPYPLWVRFIWAGNGTVVYAEILPSTPAAYCGLDENDSRRVNLSFAMELMPFQDEMTNLVTLLLAVCKQEQIRVYAINKDVLSAEDQKKLEAEIKGKNPYTTPLVVFWSFSEKASLGLDIKSPVALVQPQSNPQAISFLFQSIVQLLHLVEQLEAMSPNESGQPIVRGNGGVTATEAAQIQSSTTAVYTSISDAIDEFRAAKKRIIYESYMAKGPPDITVPVINRYPPEIIAKAGFQPWDEDENPGAIPTMVKGPRRALMHDYIFTSRDGSNRESNVQTATTLVQLIPLLTNPFVLKSITRGKFFEFINEAIRKSGAGVDLNLEPDPGEADKPIGEEDETELQQVVARLLGIVEQNSQAIKALQGGGQPGPSPGQPPNQTQQ